MTELAWTVIRITRTPPITKDSMGVEVQIEAEIRIENPITEVIEDVKPDSYYDGPA